MRGDSPRDVLETLRCQYGDDKLSQMLEAQVENRAYDAMQQCGVYDDDWPDFLDSVLEHWSEWKTTSGMEPCNICPAYQPRCASCVERHKTVST